MDNKQVTAEWIAKQRVLCDLATPGPWKSNDVRLDGMPVVFGDNRRIFDAVVKDGQSAVDADFIAAARTALPAALDALEAAYAEIASLQAERDAAVCDMFGCMSTQGQCVRCKKRYYCDGTDDDKFSPLCKNKSHCYAWEWRGLHADNTDAPTGAERKAVDGND